MENKKFALTRIKGVGPKREQFLAAMGIRNINEIIRYYPKNYIVLNNPIPLLHTQDLNIITIIAEVTDKISLNNTIKGTSVLKIMIRDRNQYASCVWFNQPFIKNILLPGTKWIFHGEIHVNEISNEMHFVNPYYEEIILNRLFPVILPIYAVTTGISQKIMRKIIKNTFEIIENDLSDPLPEKIRIENKLESLNFAIQNIHFPESEKFMEKAKKRLVFDELFYYIFELQLSHDILRNNVTGIKFEKFSKDINNFLLNIPFSLTEDQMQALQDIISDMSKLQPMNRLIQGDVGSGKTILAVIALYIAWLNHYQSAFMVPTEILAEQHYKTLMGAYNHLGIRVGLLKGGLSAKEKKVAFDAIIRGDWDIIIGTHALIQENVIYKNLGLIVTDEQHRFGVQQRMALFNKGKAPDMLIMSATPIPRTLAMILYGDLDISYIHQLPKGRKPIKTYCVGANKRDDMYNFIKKEVLMGRQCFVVCPQIEAGENQSNKSVYSVYNELTNRILIDLRINFIHGKMDNKNKDEVFEKFTNKQFDILVSTSIVEVGINIPSATIIVIEDADHFGLAQLHQLRGRVGRDDVQSYCFLIASAQPSESIEKLEILTKTNDGFVIAEKDLQIRGPGQFYGTKQHGANHFKLAPSYNDLEFISVLSYQIKRMFTDPAYEDFILRRREEAILNKSEIVSLTYF